MFKEAAKKLVGKAKASARKKARKTQQAPTAKITTNANVKPSTPSKPAGMKIPKPVKVGLIGAGLAGATALAAKVRKANSEQQ